MVIYSIKIEIPSFTVFWAELHVSATGNATAIYFNPLSARIFTIAKRNL